MTRSQSSTLVSVTSSQKNHPCVVDEDVDPPKSLSCSLRELAGDSLVADVAGDGLHRLVAALNDLLKPALGLTADDEPGSFVGEALGCARPMPLPVR